MTTNSEMYIFFLKFSLAQSCTDIFIWKKNIIFSCKM